MEYTVKNLPKSEVEIKVKVSAEILEQSRKKACEEISKEVKVDGFRKGHIPMEVLEKHVDKKYIEAHTQELAIQKSYAEIVIKENIQVIARPTVKIDSEEPLEFTATVAVMPEVEIKGYEDIKVEKKKVEVSKKDIEEVLKDLKKYGTTYKDVERACKKGDRVELDFEGFDKEGKSVEGTKSSNHPVILGEGTLIPGFEEEVEGLKKDEKKEFKITFPKDYGKADFQGKELTFKIEVKRVEEAMTPEVNDELIEQVTGKKQTVEEFKKEIEENIKARKEEEEKQRQESEYIEHLLKKVKTELPASLIEEEAHHILHDIKHDISHKGMQWDQFLEQAKTTEADLIEKYKTEGERRIKIRLALSKVIKELKIEVKEEELKAELEKVKNFYSPAEHDKIEADYKKGELKTQLFNKIALGKLFEKVIG